MAKENMIECLIASILSGENISGREELKKLSFSDIRLYAKEHKLKYSIDDIGRDQKADLIKSMINKKEK